MSPPRALIACAALSLAACQDGVTTPFPPGLEPLEDNRVPDADGAPAETLRTWDEDGDLQKVHGRGFVLAPPGAVWLAVQDPLVMVARCSTDEQAITPLEDPAYALTFLVRYTVRMVVTVEWDDQWRYGIVEGTQEAPALAMMRHQKVDGSDFIRTSTGTVQLLATDDPAVTEVAFVEHLDAIGGSVDDVRRGMVDNYNRILARTRGEATLPPCP